MPELPECLKRRHYKATDELLNALNARYEKNVANDSPKEIHNSDEIGIKFVCDLWNILKENPDCDLTRIVKERIDLDPKSSDLFKNYQCYAAETPKIGSCCKLTPRPEGPELVSTKKSTDDLSLTEVLCNLRDAASTDRKCNVKINELMEKEKELSEQIETLEQRERDAQKLLQQADCMWSCMEDIYKEKIVEKKNHIKEIEAELAQVEDNVLKWRQRKKDLESQVENVDKYYKEVTEKNNNKRSDIQAVRSELDSYQKKIKAVKADAETVKKAIEYKKSASDKKVKQYQNEIKDLEQTTKNEKSAKEKKDKEAAECIKLMRDEYTKICKTLMERKLQNSYLKSEKQALQAEHATLIELRDACKDRCEQKEQSIVDEIKKIDKEIAEFKLRCSKCHQDSSTTDIRRFCTDCPKCLEERDCLIVGDTCERDSAKDCVCMTTKMKFLSNVFENMYSVLEKEVDAPSGKSIASAILKSLEKSKNGKLDLETRKTLQRFVLDGVKKDMDLTIVGGAVKTRCEMDDKTFRQLMFCLKMIKPPSLPKQDNKGVVKKEKPACHRWPGGTECNCPKGPDSCICSQKAPLVPGCTLPTNKEDMAGRGPFKLSSSCGPDPPPRTSTATSPNAPGKSQGTQKTNGYGKIPELKYERQKKSKREKGRDCSCYTKNMRAAQCVLGPESLEAVLPECYKEKSRSPTDRNSVTKINEAANDENGKPCACGRDRKCSDRERIIEEILGRHVGFGPLGKERFLHVLNTQARILNTNTTICWYYGNNSHEVDCKLNEKTRNEPKTIKNMKSTKDHLLDILYGDSRPQGCFEICNKPSFDRDYEENPVIKVKIKSKDEYSSCKRYFIEDHNLNREELEKFKGLNVSGTAPESYILDNNKNINSVRSDDSMQQTMNTATKLKSFEPYEGNARYVKVKLEDAGDHLKDLHTLLKLTPSENFMIILDKEYEKELEAEMVRRVSNSVLLRKSLSGTYRINITNEKVKDTNIKRGKLVQSTSGKFKLIIHEKSDRTMITMKKTREACNDTSSYVLACDKEECVCRQLSSDMTNVKKSNSIVGYVEIPKNLSRTDAKTLKKIWMQPNFDDSKSEEEYGNKNSNYLRSDVPEKKKQKTKLCDKKGKRNKNVSFGPNRCEEKYYKNRNYEGMSPHQNIVYYVAVDNAKFYETATKAKEQKYVKFNDVNNKYNFHNGNRETVLNQKKTGKIIVKDEYPTKRKGKDNEYKSSRISNDLLVYSTYTLHPTRPHKCTSSVDSIVDKYWFLANKNASKKKCRHRSVAPKRFGNHMPYKKDCSGDRTGH